MQFTISPQTSFRDLLKKWRGLERKKNILEGDIEDLRLYIRHLRDSLSMDNSRAIQYDKTPVDGGSPYDAVSEYVCDTHQRIENAERELSTKVRKLSEINIDLRRIERAVNELGKEHRTVIILRYRDWCSWQTIESTTGWSKTSIYRKIDEAIESIDGGLWR